MARCLDCPAALGLRNIHPRPPPPIDVDPPGRRPSQDHRTVLCNGLHILHRPSSDAALVRSQIHGHDALGDDDAQLGDPAWLANHPFRDLAVRGCVLLGALSLTATVAAMFYTTASDAMVAPKLKYGGWESKELYGGYWSSYANSGYVKQGCPYMFGFGGDAKEVDDQEACTNVEFSGQSYRNLLAFMETWTGIFENGTTRIYDLAGRPAGTTLLYDNTTMNAAWIEKEHSNVTANFEKHSRIINNVTMAMPHPGVYAAATSSRNRILQPDDLAGVGEYAIRAGVVSPSINAMCVNMNKEELKPLVYTAWPDANTTSTGVGDQVTGIKDQWLKDIPAYSTKDGEDEYLNRTVVDDIFLWGPEHKRHPPVFQLVRFCSNHPSEPRNFGPQILSHYLYLG